VAEGAEVRLNLGCGKKHFVGYINIDFPNSYCSVKPDLECDIRTLPYEDNSVDEITAIHVFEHFYLWEAPKILDEWARVLKPGGKLALELPCLNKVIGFLNQNPLSLRNTMFALYGDPGYEAPEMVHKWCYSREHLTAMLAHRFQDIKEGRCQFHVPERDMRLVAFKKG
jgi:SAM-dependent methyltransferase